MRGTITLIQAVYVPTYDLTDPAPKTTSASSDATTGLSELTNRKYSDSCRSPSLSLESSLVRQESSCIWRPLLLISMRYRRRIPPSTWSRSYQECVGYLAPPDLNITKSYHDIIHTGVLIKTLPTISATLLWASCNIFSKQFRAAVGIVKGAHSH